MELKWTSKALSDLARLYDLTERKTLTTFPSNSWTANAKLVCSSLEYVTFS